MRTDKPGGDRTDAVMAPFRPDPDTLLATLCGLVDDQSLGVIAEADYGDGRDIHLAALREIRSSCRVPPVMRWHPHEVLSLTRWTQPDGRDAGTPRGDGRGHVMRAFACASLMRHDCLPGSGQDWEASLLPLLASARALGGATRAEACSFLSWVATQHGPDPSESALPYAVAGLLWLAIPIPGPATAADLADLCEWLASLDKDGTMFARCHTFDGDGWTAIGRELARTGAGHPPGRLGEWLGLIGACLAEG